MPKWSAAHARAGALVLIIGMLALGLAPGSLAAPAPADTTLSSSAEATPTASESAEPSPSPDPCDVLDALNADAEITDAVRTALEAGTLTSDQIVGCLTVGATGEPATSGDEVCARASGLIAAGEPLAAIVVIDAHRALKAVDDSACEKERAAADDASTTPAEVGGWWTDFQKNVLDALVPPATFALGYALILIALGRILAFLPWFRDPKHPVLQRQPTRTTAWILGYLLAAVVPTVLVVRAIYVMRDTGPGTAAIDDKTTMSEFIGIMLHATSRWWWLLAAASLITILIWSYVFASRPRVTIKVPEKDASGVDKSMLMAAIDGMVGARNSGLEFPVGTDLTTAAGDVTALSDNKFVATIQSAAKVIFGTTPWELSVENGKDSSVSISISRNGMLRTAKRIELPADHPLTKLEGVGAGDKLAALVAGELVAAMRKRYEVDFDRGLHGAISGESIALQYLASSRLADPLALRKKALPLLNRAVETDPSNRAAWATLANFRYREPDHESSGRMTHKTYSEVLDAAIDNEVLRTGIQLANPSARDLENALLRRLVQARRAVIANLNASGGSVRPRPDLDRLAREVLSGEQPKDEQVSVAIERQQMALIHIFRGWGSGDPALEKLRSVSMVALSAWNDYSVRSRPGRLSERFGREEAVLDAIGDWRQNSRVAYEMACYRAVTWLNVSRVRKSVKKSLTALLDAAARSESICEWYPSDPEMEKVRVLGLAPDSLRVAVESIEREAAEKKAAEDAKKNAPPPTLPKDRPTYELVNELLARLAESDKKDA